MEIVAVNQISPDQVILWSWGFITINVTIIYTWLVMAILVGGSLLITRNLSTDINTSRWQHFLEVIISTIPRSDYFHYPRRNQGNDQEGSR